MILAEKPRRPMLDFAKVVHEAIGVESPRTFIAIFAVIGLLLFAGIGWLIDAGYRVKLREQPMKSFEYAQQQAAESAKQLIKDSPPISDVRPVLSPDAPLATILSGKIDLEKFEVASIAEQSGELATNIRVCISDHQKRFRHSADEAALECNHLYASFVAEIRNRLRTAGATISELEDAIGLVEKGPSANELQRVANILDSLSIALAKRNATK